MVTGAKLLTVKDIASILNARPSTIYSWAEQGLIPCFKLNGLLRFSEAEVMAWIVGCQKKPAEEYNILAGRRPRKGGQI
jgi:excisionase family DNA binding protein